MPPPRPHVAAAGCGPGAPDQKEFPGYVEGSAPKSQRPAYCATLKAATPRAFDCARSTGFVRRLCPCQPVPGSQQAGQVDALDGGAGAATEGATPLRLGQQGAAGGTQR